jgi:ketosteroid isomerase-like protein
MKNQNLIYLGIVAVAGFLLFKKYNKITIAEAKALLNDWKKNFDSKNLNSIVNNYSQDGILVSTFGDILTGREAIKEYFIGLFKKNNLKVVYLDEPQIVNLNGSVTLTGLYEFSYSMILIR